MAVVVDRPNLAICAVLILFILLGTPANMAVIISICRTRNLFRHDYYHLHFHLAICDCVSLLFYILDVYINFGTSTASIVSSLIDY